LKLKPYKKELTNFYKVWQDLLKKRNIFFALFSSSP